MVIPPAVSPLVLKNALVRKVAAHVNVTLLGSEEKYCTSLRRHGPGGVYATAVTHLLVGDVVLRGAKRRPALHRLATESCAAGKNHSQEQSHDTTASLRLTPPASLIVMYPVTVSAATALCVPKRTSPVPAPDRVRSTLPEAAAVTAGVMTLVPK